MNIYQYLKRIHILEPIKPTLDNLIRLHRNHMLFIPFENLDIHLDRTIELSFSKLYQKIVIDHRGGFCYELNGLFYWLLSHLGFNVSMLAARVHNGTTFGLPFDHMLLMVKIDEQQFIADVGFGDSFQEPLLLSHEVQNQNSASYHLKNEHDDFTLYQKKQDSEALPQYTFSLTSQKLSDFEEMCTY